MAVLTILYNGGADTTAAQLLEDYAGPGVSFDRSALKLTIETVADAAGLVSWLEKHPGGEDEAETIRRMVPIRA